MCCPSAQHFGEAPEPPPLQSTPPGLGNLVNVERQRWSALIVCVVGQTAQTPPCSAWPSAQAAHLKYWPPSGESGGCGPDAVISPVGAGQAQL